MNTLVERRSRARAVVRRRDHRQRSHAPPLGQHQPIGRRLALAGASSAPMVVVGVMDEGSAGPSDVNGELRVYVPYSAINDGVVARTAGPALPAAHRDAQSRPSRSAPYAHRARANGGTARSRFSSECRSDERLRWRCGFRLAGQRGSIQSWRCAPSDGLVTARLLPFPPGAFSMEDLVIRKLKDGQFRLYSRKKNPKTGKRRNLGTFKSRAAAEKHERAVQFFKRG